MTKKKHTKSALLSSIIAALLCFSMLLGTTFAWFTDNATSGSNVITAGKLDVDVEYTLDGTNWKDLDGATDLFQKGSWEAGHTEVVALRIMNNGSLALKYTANMNVFDEVVGKNKEGENIELSKILTVSTLAQQIDQIGDIALMLAFDGEDRIAYEKTCSFSEANILASDKMLKAGDAHYVIIKVDMAETVGDEANHNGVNVPSIEFGINVLAAQLSYENDSFSDKYDENATYPTFIDQWDGTVDTSWYDVNKTTFALNRSEQIAGLSELVDSGETFEGKTIELAGNLDLYLEDENGEPICFEPIGSYRKNKEFKGTFNGKGYTISNLSQNTWALNNGYYYGDLGLGLFGKVRDAEIKNLNIDTVSISGESGLCGVVAAAAYGDCTFINITVKNSNVADYQYYAGGIVGWASGKHQYINCNIDASTTIAAQWGDFNNAMGGIIGSASSSAKILIKDCTVACRIDAFNDVTSAYKWYSYRRAGMLIGDTRETTTDEAVSHAAAPQLTCENVTVIYGEWANYTYCQFKNMEYPWVRVQSGVSTGVYSNPRYGHPTDANGNEVVDENHVHNDGEGHHKLIVFDQLYGGASGDRYCTYGTATHDGVTVIYNNK